ncbi:mechanosensitive ion channel family protein [Glaciihabitans sp. INWT7]|uniref:mechanosensitive ion channel family protein n=1 Tax=Glaciihabitans sp. INWT7 TaxID=2596912 RepID=UPI001626ADBA|nr:mechanosensitive ion channel family protein [Glaciihabitans sp. INWT7]QNE48119.1 mechanosensitive ion channel family protein [Glaciihabitans sp. INWT7]
MSDWKSWIGLGIAVVIALVAVLVVVVVTSVAARLTARRESWARALILRARMPYRVFLLVVALWIAVHLTLPVAVPLTTVDHAFLIATIAAGTWLAAALVSFGLGLATGRYRTDVADNKRARRAQTQIAIVRRLASVIIVIIGIASILLTFPGVQAVGASVLASAGVVSIVAGLAAQSTLANVFAGIQLAFSDAIRVDDVVIAETEWGRIEEITLTYVVVHIWDDRRLVLPSTYFTNTPFENWTRHSSELLGSVEFDLDWQASPSEMRERLEAILAESPLWDGRTGVLQVTDAVGGFVRFRVLVSAVDAPTLFDLRCHVREQLVQWLHETDIAALPRTRIQSVDPASRPREGAPSTEPIGLFTGTREAEERASQFTGTMPVIDPDHT